MNFLKIRDNIDIDRLLNYGFEISGKAEEYGYNIYAYDLESDADSLSCCILVNTIEHNDRVLRFYYYDDLENKITYESLEDDDGNYVGEGVDEITVVDYDIPIPSVIFEMIRDDIIEIY